MGDVNDPADASGREPDPNPLGDLDQVEEFMKARYPEVDSGKAMAGAGVGAGEAAAGEGADKNLEKEFGPNTGAVQAAKPRHKFRDYRAGARDCVKEFYRLNHTYQTYEFVQARRREFLSLDRRTMGIWEAIEYLNTGR